MSLTPVEQRYLTEQPRGHLATVAPNGAPHVKPVGFAYNAELGTIDVTGFNMVGSAKYRNVQAHPEVAFVVDDVLFEAFEGVRFLEVRGRAEPAVVPRPADHHLDPDVIRIHPRRVVSLNIDPDDPGFHTRDIETDTKAGATTPG